jgi:hypothetical protein
MPCQRVYKYGWPVDQTGWVVHDLWKFWNWWQPIWSYGIELWGCANKSHIVIMKRTQSKILRSIANSPWYVTNHTLHSDLKVPYVRDVIHERIGKHHTKPALLEPLLQPACNRRLNRCWPFDLQDTWGDMAGCTLHHITVSRPHISSEIDCNTSDC